MSSSKRLPNKSQRPIGPTADEIVIPDDAPPGYTLDTYPPGSPPEPAEIRSNTDEIVNTAADIEGKIYAQLDEGRAEIEATVEQAKAAVLGQLRANQDDINKTVERVVGKIAKQLDANQREINSDAYALGFGYQPQPDYREAGGTNYLGGVESGQGSGVPGTTQDGPSGGGPMDGGVRGPGGGSGGPPPPTAGGFGGGGQPGSGPPGIGPQPDPGCVAPSSVPYANQPPATYTPGEYVDPWIPSEGDRVCFQHEVTKVYVCIPGQPGVYNVVGIAHPPGGFLYVTPNGGIAWNLYGPLGPQVFSPPGATTSVPPTPGCESAPPGQPPGQPQPPGGNGQCLTPGQANIAANFNFTPFGQPILYTPHPVTGTMVAQPVTAAVAMGYGCRWTVEVCSSPGAGGQSTGASVAVPYDVIPVFDAAGLLWFIGITVAIPQGWTLAPESLVHSVGVCTSAPPAQPPPLPEGVFCPPPPPAACNPPPKEWPQLGTGNVEACRDFDEFFKTLLTANISPESVLTMGMSPLATPVALVGQVVQWITGRQVPVVPDLVGRAMSVITNTIKNGLKIGNCDAPRVIAISLYQAVIGFLQQWTGTMPLVLRETLQQAANLQCQYDLPDGAQADAAYLSGRITKEVWECWHKTAGNIIGPAEAVMESKRTRPEATQLTMLFRRGIITEDTWNNAMRSVGVLRDEDRERIFHLTDYLPGPSDLVRFAVKDVEDKDIVDRFQLDYQFEKKYGPLLAPLGEANGITKDIMLLYWRAHWRRSSPGQMFEMVQRLRPGRVPKEIETTLDDIRLSMSQEDYTQWDIDRLIAISYKKLTRIDIRQGFIARAWDEGQLFEMYQDLGYNSTDAQNLVQYQKKARKILEAKRSGLPTARTLINQYSRGEVDDGELREQLEATGYEEEQLDNAIESAKIARRTWVTAQGTKWVKQKYLAGMMDTGEAVSELQLAGVGSADASGLVSLWTRIRSFRGKLPTAQMLCKWRSQNLITADQQFTALVRVGWGYDDANRIVGSCTADLVEKEIARREKIASKLQKQLEAERKDREKEAKERAKALEGVGESQTAS